MTKQKVYALKLSSMLITMTVGITGATINKNALADEVEKEVNIKIIDNDVNSINSNLKISENSLSDIVREELEKNMILFTPKTQQNSSAILKMQSQDKEFKRLNSKNLFRDKEFKKRLGNIDLIQARKLIFEMQSFAKYISEKYNVDSSITEDIVYSTYIESHKNEISPVLMLSLIGIESTFNPMAKSVVGATGLTQVMPQIHRETVKKLGADVHSISGNIKVGITILKEYITIDGGNIRKALQRYNGSYNDRKLTYSNLVFNNMEVFKSIQEQNKKIFSVFDV